jgi:hypothetical protein
MHYRHLIPAIVFVVISESDAVAQELDASILPSQFDDCRSSYGFESQSPFLVVRPGGIEVVSEAIPGGRTTIPASELRSILMELPVEAWGHGRIVGAQNVSLIGSRSDLVPIAENHEVAEAVLDDLGLMVCWYPS